MAKTEKSSLATILANLQKETQIGSTNDVSFAVGAYSTGNIAVDFRTGVGGYPKGRIVEQYGPKSSGKTTLALQALAEAQKECIRTGEGYIMFLDYEKTFDIPYATHLGIDTTHHSFIIYKPDTFEEGANAYRELLQTGELRLAVFDSVAAMITENEINSDTGSSKVADRAKMMHQFCRQITPVLSKTDSTAIFLNHIMEKVDATFMGQKMAAAGIKQYTRPGGTALDFYASLQLEFKQKKFHKVKQFDALTNEVVEQVRQTDIEMKIVKNKVADPQGTAMLRVRFGEGFSQPYSIFQILLAHGLVIQKGAWYYMNADIVPETLRPKKMSPEGVGFQGEEKALAKIEAHPEWQADLEARARKILEEMDPKTAKLNFEESVVEDVDVDSILSGGSE